MCDDEDEAQLGFLRQKRIDLEEKTHELSRWSSSGESNIASDGLHHEMFFSIRIDRSVDLRANHRTAHIRTRASERTDGGEERLFISSGDDQERER